jgi:hypothetical protein
MRVLDALAYLARAKSALDGGLEILSIEQLQRVMAVSHSRGRRNQNIAPDCKRRCRTLTAIEHRGLIDRLVLAPRRKSDVWASGVQISDKSRSCRASALRAVA